MAYDSPDILLDALPPRTNERLPRRIASHTYSFVIAETGNGPIIYPRNTPRYSSRYSIASSSKRFVVLSKFIEVNYTTVVIVSEERHLKRIQVHPLRAMLREALV